MWNAVPLKTDIAMVHICPSQSVVLGCVIDIGESPLWQAATGAISRLRE
jgi:hypothetical protein